MTYLLDTHVWLWILTKPERLSGEAADVIADQSSALVLSGASSWEIAIKYAIGRLSLPSRPSVYVPSRLRASGVRGMPIEHAHCLAVAELPPLHRDPFDRLIVAHAQLEGYTVITGDEQIQQYDVDVIAA